MAGTNRFLFRMVLFVIAVGVATGLLFQPLSNAFLANAALNGLILGVLLLGILNNFRQVAQLKPEVAWIEHFRTDAPAAPTGHAIRLLAPMASMIGEKRDRLSLSTLSLRTLLDGIASRLDESRDLSRYTIGLLIFLGLLGTFWGLLETVGSISDVIGGLSVAGGDMGRVFDDLKSGLQTPLAGMGTAFSSSLFGLAGSLVLGFLDLQAGQAQNRFYNDLEEWLSALTKISSGPIGADGEQTVPAYVQALLEQTADSLQNLQRVLARGEETRIQADRGLIQIGERIATLTDQMRTEQAVLINLAETQVELKTILARLADSVATKATESGLDDASRAHIRNLDGHVARLAEELRGGREDAVQQLRSEIKLLARTMAAVIDGKSSS